MAWIKTIETSEAKGRLKQLYDSVVSPIGHIDNVLKIHSLRPRTLHAHLLLYKATLHTKPNELSPRERELIGVCVSLLNGCDYCVKHHQAGLAKHVESDELAQELALASIGEINSPNLTDKEKAMCDYAIKLTNSPKEVRQYDIERLRAVGLTDEGILDVNQIIAYFAYVNRTVVGLGVEIKGEPLGYHPDENQEGFKHN